MKKTFLLFAVFAAQVNFAQSVFPTNGNNVGIGTLSPVSKLHVVGTITSYEPIALSSTVNSYQLINSISGNVGNILINNLWTYRDGTLNNWFNARLHDGISIDASFKTPNLDTKTWWERDPKDNIQSWGNDAVTYMTINQGNVGIGTISPAAKLDVNSAAIAATFKSTTNSVPVTIVNTGTTVASIGFKGSTSLTEYNVRVGADGNDFAAYTANAERMRINSIGNTGIGTANPLAKLEVYNGNILVRNAANVDNESNIMIAHSIKYADKDTFGTSLRTITQSAGTNAYGMQFFTQESYVTGQTEKLRILGNGNVGIGVISPTNKLDVNGTIHSKEVKVDMLGWSDFVFKKEYNLPTLEEVEKHIAEKGHLKNIPSEEEVLKNGINLGEMNSKLLQKIEELTLYVIEQNKRLGKLENENMELKNQVNSSKRN